MPPKTNAVRLLDQMGIHYELREYEVDPNDLAAETVAAKIGLPLKQVFKTLVARPDRSKDRNKDPNKDPNKDRRGICMAVIPGDQELNLKALASAAGERKIQLVPVFDTISISAGVRGLQILIAPAEYLRATQGTIAALAEPKRE